MKTFISFISESVDKSDRSNKMEDHFPISRSVENMDKTTPKHEVQHGFNRLKAEITPDDRAAHRGVRDKDLPIHNVPVEHIVATQSHLDHDKVDKHLQSRASGRSKSYPLAHKYKGKYHIIDGHHRAVADKLRGAKSIKMRVRDLSHADDDPDHELSEFIKKKTGHE